MINYKHEHFTEENMDRETPTYAGLTLSLRKYKADSLQGEISN